MFETKADRYRPTREFDGQGSRLVPGAASVLYCDPVLQDGEMSIVFDAIENVKVGDLIELPYAGTLEAY